MKLNSLSDLSKATQGKRLKSNQMFTDENIQKIFGHEAADDEPIERLKQYYVKNVHYEKITANLKLRILVGHKGIGKSAMFKIAAYEDERNNILPIAIRPDDIVDLKNAENDFLEDIRIWKKGLSTIIATKILQQIGIDDDSVKGRFKKYSSMILEFVNDTINLEGVSFDPTKSKIRDKFIKENRVNIYIDDLDRGWKGREKDISMISSLINAVRDLSNQEGNIHFKIALRSDVYYLYRTSDESTDKVGGSVIWLTWTNHEILALLVKRIATFFGKEVHEDDLFNTPQYKLAKELERLIEPTFRGEGHWANTPIHTVLMSLIRKRPRDLVKLCSLAAQKAYLRKSNKINTLDWEDVFPTYSNDRLLDTEIEYKSELPSIMRLMLGMKPSVKRRKASESYSYTTDGLISKIRSIMQTNNFMFANGTQATAEELSTFLYKINFITARKQISDGTVVRKYFEDHNYLMQHIVDFGFQWEVHPAYRWALQPDDPKTIYQRLELLNFED